MVWTKTTCCIPTVIEGPCGTWVLSNVFWGLEMNKMLLLAMIPVLGAIVLYLRKRGRNFPKTTTDLLPVYGEGYIVTPMKDVPMRVFEAGKTILASKFPNKAPRLPANTGTFPKPIGGRGGF